MKLIIDIDEHKYEWLKRNITMPTDIEELILNGTPLPKGHERLIILSEDVVKRVQMPMRFSCQNWISEVGLSNATVAIIEADKGDNK